MKEESPSPNPPQNVVVSVSFFYRPDLKTIGSSVNFEEVVRGAICELIRLNDLDIRKVVPVFQFRWEHNHSARAHDFGMWVNVQIDRHPSVASASFAAKSIKTAIVQAGTFAAREDEFAVHVTLRDGACV